VNKFNVPPGWPAAEPGWIPPEGWTPDPSWPPAPDGWQFWTIEADPSPVPPSSARTITVPSPALPAKRRRWLAPTLTGIAGLVLGIIIGSAVGSGSSTSGAAPAAAPAPATTVTVAAAPVPAVTVTVAPPAPPAPAGPASTIAEGTWTVGTDIAAGAYKTTAAVTSGCYWKISTSGSNGSDIVSNDLPTGGFPTVTLKVGQDFTTTSCGDWAKQG